MANVVRIAGVQMDVLLGNVTANVAKIRGYLEEAHRGGAFLVVFPECAITGYCFETLAEALTVAEAVPGPATLAIAETCAAHGIYAVVGTLERDGAKLYNAAVLIGPAGVVGCYRKTHLPYLGVDRFTTPGDVEPAVYQCGPLRVGMNICYDGSFPEISRVLALDGVDLICLPTNWPTGAECPAEVLVNARAIENHIYYIAVNRTGEERGFRFIGKSRLADPRGGNIAGPLDREEAILYGDLDPAIPRNKHLVRVPGKHEVHRFRDRQPHLYERLVAPVKLDLESPPDQPEAQKLEHIQRALWAPWRLAYVTADQKTRPGPRMTRPARPESELAVEIEKCFICKVTPSDRDRENLVILRTEHTLTVLNRFPYNNGHLLVAPRKHKARLEELSPEEHLDCMQTLSRFIEIFDDLMTPDGYNVGLNLGRAAGAGLPGHLHWHIVPRWNGDTNFMPVLAGTRVIPQSLDALWELLRAAVEHAT